MKPNIIIILAIFCSVIVNAQNVGIGTSSPSTNLDVNGTVRIRGGAPAEGKVLSSSSDGTAAWTTPTSPSANTGFLAQFENNVTLSSGTPNFILLPFVDDASGSVIVFDHGNNFDNTTHVYTAPSNGLYAINLKLHYYSNTNSGSQNGQITLRLKYEKANGFVFYTYWYGGISYGLSINQTIQGNLNLNMNLGDKISVEIYQTTGYNLLLSTSTSPIFTAYKIY